MLHSAAKHPMPLQRALMHIDNHADLIHKYACVHLERNPLTERLCNELPRSPSSHQSHNTSEPLRQTYIEKQTDLIPKHACVHLERNHLAETLVNELTRSPTSHQSHDTSEHPKSQQLGPSSITCSNCNRTFTNKYNLWRHEINIHQPRQKNNIRCRLCQKTFARHDSLQRHLKFHRGERRHICNICHKTFVTSACLKRHLHIHRH